MFHKIQFSADRTVDLEVSPKRPLERLRIRKGTLLEAEIKPYAVETPMGIFEVADLQFADGSTARLVPFEMFTFVE